MNTLILTLVTATLIIGLFFVFTYFDKLRTTRGRRKIFNIKRLTRLTYKKVRVPRLQVILETSYIQRIIETNGKYI